MSRHMKLVPLALSALCLVLAHGQAGAAATAGALDQNATTAVDTEARAQRSIDAWNDTRDQLLEEARTLKYELQWLELQRLKLDRYVTANDEKIAALEEAQGRYAVIALELENSLLHELDRLDRSIAQSPPFLAEERASRARFLRQSLNDPELSIGEKYRRFTEGLNAEVAYGRHLELTNGVGRLDGEEMDLVFVRAGRIGYYCLTMDRSRGGIWDADAGQFAALEGDRLQAVQNLEVMAQTKQFYNFAVAPVRGTK